MKPDPVGLDAYRRVKFDGLPPNRLYAYADNHPINRFDPLGLKVEICERPAELPGNDKLGLPHQWVKTDTGAGGMGPKGGGVPGQGGCDCPGRPTVVVDHSGETGPDVTCTVVEDVD